MVQDKKNQAVLYIQNINSNRLAIWQHWARNWLLNNYDESEYQKIESRLQACFEYICGLVIFCHADEIMAKYTMENSLSIFNVKYWLYDVQKRRDACHEYCVKSSLEYTHDWEIIQNEEAKTCKEAKCSSICEFI